MINLIFGVSGQDGSYLAELLLDQGHTVVGIARRTSNGNTSRIEHLLDNKDFELLTGDITDFGSVISILRKVLPARIYNLAAQSHVGTSFAQACSSLDITAKGCVNILEAIRILRAELPGVRMYQASSSEMFGTSYSTRNCEAIGILIDGGRHIYRDKDGRLSIFEPSSGVKYQDENTPFCPQSPYAIAKLAAHNYCRLYREAYGIDIRCGILFNHESPRRGEEFVTRKITKYLARLHKHIQEKSDELYGESAWSMTYYMDGKWNNASIVCNPTYEREILDSAPRLKLGSLESIRDWGHAKDYVRAMTLMMDVEVGKDYVVATGESHSIKHFLNAAFIRADCGNWRNFVDYDMNLARPCEVPFLKGDSSLIRKELGWEPKYSFESLVEEMIEHDRTLIAPGPPTSFEVSIS